MSDDWVTDFDTAINEACRVLKVYEETLNQIASWNEGPIVTGKFDEPVAAELARAALKNARELIEIK